MNLEQGVAERKQCLDTEMLNKNQQHFICYQEPVKHSILVLAQLTMIVLLDFQLPLLCIYGYMHDSYYRTF